MSIESQQNQQRKKMGRRPKFDEGFRKTALERVKGCEYITGLAHGRKVELTPDQIAHARKLIDKGEARQYVADLLNVGRSTFYWALVVA